MIYTITLNSSLDYVMKLDHLELGETNRSYRETIFPGGKGFNVSTILTRLGVDNIALGYIGGFTGKEIQRLLDKRHIKNHLITLSNGISRINVKIKGQEETEVNASGPIINEDELEQLFIQLDSLSKNDTLVMSGSIPSTIDNNIYELIMKRLAYKHIRFIIDTTNESLLKTLDYKPFLIKPNLRELEEIFDTSITNQDDIIQYAKKLQNKGAMNVLVSLGKDGALLVSEDHHIYTCDSAKGKLINSVGSGDSMVAGFIAGYLKNGDYKEALQLGSACGGANAFSEDLADKKLIDEVYNQLEVKEIKNDD